MTSADVVMIGGGIIGASAAYHLAKRGLRAALVEGQEIASGASGACDGFVWLRTKAPGPLLDLARHSVRRYESLGDELDAEVHYRRCGGLILVETQAQRRALPACHSEPLDCHSERSEESRPPLQGARHYLPPRGGGLGWGASDDEWISPDTLHRAFPFLSPRLLGASYCEGDGTVDSLRTTWAFVRAAQRLGAQIILGEPVTSIVVRRGRVAAAKTAKRSIACGAVVNCAGSWGGEVARLAGVELPITPRRGQLLVSEPLPPIIASGGSPRSCETGPSMVCACYLTHKSRRIKAGDDDMLVSFSMEQTVEGNLVIGSTRESAGYDRSVTPEGMAEITAHARRVAPGLADVHIIRAFAGLRPYTPDGLPFIGETEVRGFWVACGHEGDGIATAPGTGDLLAALLTGDAPPVAPEPFSPARL